MKPPPPTAALAGLATPVARGHKRSDDASDEATSKSQRSFCIINVNEFAHEGDLTSLPLLKLNLTVWKVMTIILTWMTSTSSTAQGGGGSFKKRKTIGEIGCESRMSEQKH